MKTKKSENRFPIFPTAAAAAGALGVNRNVLLAAKKAGAPGFDAANRVDSGKLLAWALTGGKTFEPELTLEQAKARLANVRAQQIEREAAKAGGLVSPLWVASQVEDAFGGFDQWFRSEDRVDRIAVLVTGGPLDTGSTENVNVVKNLKIALDDDARSIRVGMHQVRDHITRALASGPDGAGDNDAGRLLETLRAVMKQLSPTAAQELQAALEHADDHAEDHEG